MNVISFGTLPVRRTARACLLISILLAQYSYAVVPTEAEWQLWPDYCRARFKVAGDGEGTPYQIRISDEEVAHWKLRMPGAWHGLHHYCYGLVYMHRAAVVPEGAERKHLLRNAVGEFTFEFRSTPASDSFFGQTASELALAYRQLGDDRDALVVANDVLNRAPNMSAGYLIKAIVLRNRKDLSAAAALLRRGLDVVGKGAADLHYALGLTLLDMHDIKEAKAQAEAAYRLGYPLPGLRNRLRKHGVSIDTSDH